MTKIEPQCLKSMCAAALLWLGAGSATAAQMKVQSCIPAPAAEALFLSIAPEALRKVGQICAPSLPPGATLRRSPIPMVGRYAAEADAAWPAARGALAAIVGRDAEGLLDSDLARPLVTTMATELIAKDIAARDCPAIDRILTLVEPLPPRNAAGLIVTILQVSQKETGRNGFSVCAAGRAK